MDNMHQPPGGDPQDFWPTQELNVAAGRPRRHGRAAWWGAGLALAALLAGGGFAAAEISGGSSPAPGGPTGQAATLNAALSAASSPAAAAAQGTARAVRCRSRAAKLKAAGHPAAARAAVRLCRRPLLRLRLVGGEHGQFTFAAKSGARTIAFERGVVRSVSGSDVVVQAKDGTTWTWLLEGDTVVRQRGERASTGALSTGEHVFAGGPVAGGGYDARLIVIAAGSGGAASPGGAGSAGSQGSQGSPGSPASSS
jgi:hypothetical protein